MTAFCGLVLALAVATLITVLAGKADQRRQKRERKVGR